jgi:hypothetical protein
MTNDEPSTITLGSSTGFTTTYGMPLLYVYNMVEGLPSLVSVLMKLSRGAFR